MYFSARVGGHSTWTRVGTRNPLPARRSRLGGFRRSDGEHGRTQGEGGTRCRAIQKRRTRRAGTFGSRGGRTDKWRAGACIARALTLAWGARGRRVQKWRDGADLRGAGGLMRARLWSAALGRCAVGNQDESAALDAKCTLREYRSLAPLRPCVSLQLAPPFTPGARPPGARRCASPACGVNRGGHARPCLGRPRAPSSRS